MVLIEHNGLRQDGFALLGYYDLVVMRLEVERVHRQEPGNYGGDSGEAEEQFAPQRMVGVQRVTQRHDAHSSHLSNL